MALETNKRNESKIIDTIASPKILLCQKKVEKENNVECNEKGFWI